MLTITVVCMKCSACANMNALCGAVRMATKNSLRLFVPAGWMIVPALVDGSADVICPDCAKLQPVELVQEIERQLRVANGVKDE